VYEYRCADRGAQFERRLPFTMADSKLTRPSRGEARAKRMLSTFAQGSQPPGSVQRTAMAPRSGFT